MQNSSKITRVLALIVLGLSYNSYRLSNALRLADIDKVQAVKEERIKTLKEQEEILRKKLEEIKTDIAKPISNSEIETFWKGVLK